MPFKRKSKLKWRVIFYEDSFLPGSSFIMRAENQNHWGSLAIAVSGRKNKMRIYPESMVRALLRSQEIDPKKSESSVIWGRVLRDGKPLKGASVELAGGLAKPIYFNAYIPDPQLKGTKTEGLFAFVGLPSGLQAVRVSVDGRFLSTHLIVGEEGHVSSLDIEVGDHRSAGIVSYDGQTGKLLPVDVEVYGTEKSIVIEGDEREAIHFAGGSGIMMLEVSTNDNYLPSRYSVSRSQKFIDLPMVRTSWLYQMKARSKVEQMSDLGIIVSYVNGSDYEASLGGEETLYDEGNIIYFDSKGKTSTHALGDEGGFILFNVPLGVQEVVVRPVEGDQVFTQVSIVGEDLINVIPVLL